MLELPPSMPRNWSAPVFDDFAESWLLYRDAALADVVNHCRSGLSYLASPYTKLIEESDGGFDPSMSLECAVAAAHWSRLFAMSGVTAVSPVIQMVEMVHCDFVDICLDPLDARFWADWRRPLLQASDYVIVPPMSGWAESDGIWRDVYLALSAQKPVFLLAADGDHEGIGHG